MMTIVKELCDHLHDVEWHITRLRRLTPITMRAAYAGEHNQQVIDELQGFWTAHNGVRNLIWRLPVEVTSYLSTNWQFDVSKALRKLGDSLRRTLPEYVRGDVVTGFIQCTPFLLTNDFADQIKVIQDARGDVWSAGEQREAVADTIDNQHASIEASSQSEAAETLNEPEKLTTIIGRDDGSDIPVDLIHSLSAQAVAIVDFLWRKSHASLWDSLPRSIWSNGMETIEQDDNTVHTALKRVSKKLSEWNHAYSLEISLTKRTVKLIRPENK